jgi:phosphate/sulfate permease
MKRLTSLATAIVLAGTIAFAHGGNDHVRGIVTQISAQSITVQTADKATKTLALSEKTGFRRAGKNANLADVKVGDRVVIDVAAKTTNALLIQIGAAKSSPPHKD